MNFSIKNCSVYFIHYSRLKDRLSTIKNNISLLGIELPDNCLILENLISQKRILNQYEFAQANQKALVSRQLLPMLYPILLNVDKKLADELESFCSYPSIDYILERYKFIDMKTPSKATIEHCFQHYFAMARFLLDNNDLCLILEDDAIYNSRNSSLHDILCYSKDISDKSLDGCYFDLSNGCGLTANADEIESSACLDYFDRLQYKRTRTTVSYLIDKSAAVSFLKRIVDIYMAIDWHLTFCMQSSNIECYWIRNPLFLEGSSMGSFASNASNRINGL